MIDPSIALGVKPVQFDSPLNSLAQMYQIKQAQQQGQMGDIAMQEKQQSMADSNKLRGLFATPGFDIQSPDAIKQVMAINPTQGMAMQKARLDNAKAQGDIDKTAFDTASKAHTIYQNTIGALAYSPNLSKDAVVQAGQGLVQAGILKPEMYQQAIASMPDDPVALKEKLLQGVHAQLTPEQLMTAFAPKPTQINNGQQISFRDTNPTSPTYGQATGGTPVQLQQSPDSKASTVSAAASRAQADRHFNITQENSKGQVVQTDNGPVLIDTRTGAGKVINGPDGKPLAGVTKPLNDSQSKALLFGTRMQEANRVLEQLAEKGSNSSTPGSRAPFVGGMINALSGEKNQMLNQAKTDFMTAVLRRESGASISPGEFDTADKQYFPEINDPPSVIAQKARNRQLAINGILVEVPEKSRGAITPSASVKETKPSGTIKVATAADYEKVPSGAEYITPDGHTRRKP